MCGRIVRCMVLTAVAVLTTHPSLLWAKPEKAPINVEYVVPANMATGDEVTTVIGFRATADIDLLKIAIHPFMGVEMVSGAREATFANVRKGTAPQIEVRVRLTDPKVGLLAITYQTAVGQEIAAGAINIAYGDTSG